MAYQVFFNLDDLLPDSPDVLALRFKAALRFPDDKRFPVPNAQLKSSPLLRASLEALLQAESRGHAAIEDGSLLEQLAPNLYYDCPWATYRPPARPQASLGDWDEDSLEDFSMGVSKGPSTARMEGEPWMIDTVKQALELTSTTGREPNWNSLASSLGIPLRKMKRMVEQIRS
jgi:hypothetical protein